VTRDVGQGKERPDGPSAGPGNVDYPPDLRRPLHADERAALLAVLMYADFEGRDALIAQTEAVQVIGYCSCGCASVDLVVDRSKTPPARGTRSPITNGADVLDAEGSMVGGMEVFLDEDGYLSLLDVNSWLGAVTLFPPLDRLRFHRRV
jgi:hypothetical protein